MKKFIIGVICLGAILIGCGQPSGFTPGIVDNADKVRAATAGNRLGARLARVEFNINTPAANMRATVGDFANKGMSVILLAGFHGRIPTSAEAQNLGNWAREFGPGGTFWQSRSDGVLAVNSIEFGNETSYRHQYGDTDANDPDYIARARTYAQRFREARIAIDNSGHALSSSLPVGLLAQADDGGTGSANWVNNMYSAVPELNNLVSGWVVHPYGPRTRWEPKIDRLVAQVGAKGGGNIPIDVTEYGIASDNGRALTDNYQWPVNMTYQQAADALTTTVSQMRAKLGNRLRYFMIYQATDNRPTGAASGNNRETWFGALQYTLAEKGAYSQAVRNIFNQATQQQLQSVK